MLALWFLVSPLPPGNHLATQVNFLTFLKFSFFWNSGMLRIRLFVKYFGSLGDSEARLRNEMWGLLSRQKHRSKFSMAKSEIITSKFLLPAETAEVLPRPTRPFIPRNPSNKTETYTSHPDFWISFFWPHPQHKEVPGPGIKSKP